MVIFDHRLETVPMPPPGTSPSPPRKGVAPAIVLINLAFRLYLFNCPGEVFYVQGIASALPQGKRLLFWQRMNLCSISPVAIALFC